MNKKKRKLRNIQKACSEKVLATTACISYGWVRAYLENPSDFPQAVDRLELSVTAHATTHTHKRSRQCYAALRIAANVRAAIAVSPRP